MKELERWWHWYDTEHPELSRAMQLMLKRCSGRERDALLEAAMWIRAGRAGVQRLAFADRSLGGPLEQAVAEQLLAYPKAMRRLSLALCAELEELDGTVKRDFTATAARALMSRWEHRLDASNYAHWLNPLFKPLHISLSPHMFKVSYDPGANE